MATIRLTLNRRARTASGCFRTSFNATKLAEPAVRGVCSIRPFHQQQTLEAATEAPSTPKAIAPRPKLRSTRHQPTGRPSLGVRPISSESQRLARYSTAAASSHEPTIHSDFEIDTQTWQYVVADPSTKTAVIIDAVLDYDPATQVITTKSADSLLSLVKEKGYNVAYILETHAHADHLTASSYLQKQLLQTQGARPPIGIGKRVGKVQELFGKRYGIAAKEYTGVFDKLFEDDEEFDIGIMKAKAMHLPGHTPDHLGYKIGDNVFCGDSVFHADIGTARCDFPGGSANMLWNSARKLLRLPENTKIWTGHDYPPDGRTQPVPFLTVKEHKTKNKHLKDGITEDDFVKMRMERDDSLGAPRLLHQSLQLNIRGGKLPAPTEAGQRLLHLPLKLNGLEW